MASVRLFGGGVKRTIASPESEVCPAWSGVKVESRQMPSATDAEFRDFNAAQTTRDQPQVVHGHVGMFAQFNGTNGTGGQAAPLRYDGLG